MLSRLRGHLSYANVMASLAVFLVVAGGAAWALDRNSVRSKHIKNSSVTFKDLKDIKFKVKRVTPSASNDDPDVAQANARKVTLFRRGAVSIYGKCFFEPDADTVYSELYASSKKAGTLLEAYEGDQLLGDPDYLNRNSATAEVDRELSDLSASVGSVDSEWHDNAILLLAKGQRLVYGRGINFVKNGPLPNGEGAWGPGDRCLFGVVTEG